MFDPDSSLPAAKMEDGAFLIDASPSSFPVILHWLRYREVSLGEVTVETALSAANYFGLHQLVQALEEIIKKKEEEIIKKKKEERSQKKGDISYIVDSLTLAIRDTIPY